MTPLVEPLRKASTLAPVERPRKVSESQRVIPTPETPRLICKYYDQQSWDDPNVDYDLWATAEEIQFNNRCSDAVEEGPMTYGRFLWSDTHLMFYVEVLDANTGYECDNNSQVWNGNNIEFIIAPRWLEVPCADEYEFLFNSSGAENTLHWLTGGNLEQALHWKPNGLQWAVSKT